MSNFEQEARARWAHLPEAEPPPHLRAAVLSMLGQDRSRGRASSALAMIGIAAMFVLAIALPTRVEQPSRPDPEVAMLRAHGVEVASPPTRSLPAEVRRVAIGSAAARLGLRAGDKLLALDADEATGGMLNLAVLRGNESRYFALPELSSMELGAGGAGMALAPHAGSALMNDCGGCATAVRAVASFMPRLS